MSVYCNQTELGKIFGISAKEVGKLLTQLGLKEGTAASAKALQEGYAKSTPLKDGTPHYLWHRTKVKQLLKAKGLQPKSHQEVLAAELAAKWIKCEALYQSNDGLDQKAALLMADDILEEIKHTHTLALVNQILQSKGYPPIE